MSRVRRRILCVSRVGPHGGVRAHEALEVVLIAAAFGPPGRVVLLACGGVHVSRRRAHQCQIPAASPHHFNDKGALMTGGCAGKGVNGFCDPVERCVGTDGHVGAVHVVVDRPDEADDVEGRMTVGHILADPACLDRFGQQCRPFLAKDARTGQAAVATDHDQIVYLVMQQIASSTQATFAGAKLGAACRPDGRASLLQDATYVPPLHLADSVPAVYQPLKSFVDGVHFQAAVERRAHHGAHRGVHAWSVTPAGQYAETFQQHQQSVLP